MPGDLIPLTLLLMSKNHRFSSLQLAYSPISSPCYLSRVIRTVSCDRLASDDDREDKIPRRWAFLCPISDITLCHRLGSPEFRESGISPELSLEGRSCGLREKRTMLQPSWQAQLLGVQELEGPSESSQVGLRPPGLYSPRSLSQGTWEGEGP